MCLYNNTRILYILCDGLYDSVAHACMTKYTTCFTLYMKIVSVTEHGTAALHDKQETAEEDGTNESTLQTSKIDPTCYCQSSKVGVASTVK